MDTKSDFSDSDKTLINTSTTELKLLTTYKLGLSVSSILLLPNVVSILSCSDMSIFNVAKPSKDTSSHYSISLGNTKG